MLKIALVFVKNVFFGLKKGISELSRWVAQKHTAPFLKYFLGGAKINPPA